MENNMNINFKYLKERVIDSLSNSNLKLIREELRRIKGPTIISGVGGSNVVSEFTSKTLQKKNAIITISSEPRSFLYRDNSLFENVIACSYSGNNYGVELSFQNELKKYLLSNHSFDDNEVTYLTYQTTFPEEKSFISLAATLIPISIVLDYYLEGEEQIIEDSIKESLFHFDAESDIYEIFTGYDTSTASKYLESTLIEAGIGIPIIHDKYSYCHGRSTFGKNFNGTTIYFNRNTEFDHMILKELEKYHKRIIVIESH